MIYYNKPKSIPPAEIKYSSVNPGLISLAAATPLATNGIIS